jgi:hypothetical protein
MGANDIDGAPTGSADAGSGIRSGGSGWHLGRVR